jgi:hypothetical protein
MLRLFCTKNATYYTHNLFSEKHNQTTFWREDFNVTVLALSQRSFMAWLDNKRCFLHILLSIWDWYNPPIVDGVGQ